MTRRHQDAADHLATVFESPVRTLAPGAAGPGELPRAVVLGAVQGDRKVADPTPEVRPRRASSVY